MNAPLCKETINFQSSKSRAFFPLIIAKPNSILNNNKIAAFIFNNIKLLLFQACFELEQCAGVIGGRPNHALYYLGYTCDDLICLDPHETQMAVSVGTKSTPEEEEADSTYHTEQFYRWHMDQLDPSIALVRIIQWGSIDFVR